MSDKTRQSLQLGVGIITVALAISSAIGAFYVLPYRMSAAEAAISKMQDERKTDRELLLRIDERTARMDKTLDRLVK